ncbi:cobalamin-dependent protein [Pseudemcibacter aquimaris]|uniref:cobalamin-dependent protein n=1 Tax=Pseudemcibacter aquimaris TaxID=2857064 RepID=UPI00201299CA|nr:cobalamin-dependent protein [Pseudemcibacter aquimaris]MCC3861204.1 cobalamin-dependent protein [Pseudemcibacter aquimaris]WDU57979.1 cobalamin-dependent protein [Pseudemcibacter aquimaris]
MRISYVLNRKDIFPEDQLPDVNVMLQVGKDMAREVTVGDSPFLSLYGVKSEKEYKEQQVKDGRVMLHGQIGFRSPIKSQDAYKKIYEDIADAGYRIDRYGICLDWSMGYPKKLRAGMPKGTGLILDNEGDFAALTKCAPVAPHFGDFVMGTPAAFENTIAALKAGSTTIGNIGQFFNFRMPHWNDDITTTAETVKALALCAAQPVDILIHSNLDDGFSALFCDLTCSIGAVLIEQYIVDELIGANISHCYGHTFSDPLTRLAFQRALERVSINPGSMVYGNTTIYGPNTTVNYSNLASYMMPDIIGQMTRPTGHGLNPVPVTEALRIPDTQEIIDAHLFTNRLIERTEGFVPMIDYGVADDIADTLIEAGTRFKESVLKGLEEAGIDINNPFELLLSIRRIGAKKLEELYGPGEIDHTQIRNRKPVIKATTVAELENKADEVAEFLSAEEKEIIKDKRFRACVACTDVHEYGKVLIEAVLNKVDVNVIDGGVSTDPEVVVKEAQEKSASFIAISTYNGVALDYITRLRKELADAGLSLPIFIGGKLNQVKDDDHSSLPVDVSDDLRQLGVTVCLTVEDLLTELVRMVQGARYD